MQVENHKEEVPFSHYEGLFRNLDPQAALERLPSAAFDGKRFTLTLLGRTYDITWPDYAITADRDGAFGLSSLPCQTFLLRFLLEAGRPHRQASSRPSAKCPGARCTSSPTRAAS